MNLAMIISTPASQLARLSGAGCGETRTSSSNRKVRGFIAPIDPTFQLLVLLKWNRASSPFLVGAIRESPLQEITIWGH
jgi:hypothetical protein